MKPAATVIACAALALAGCGMSSRPTGASEFERQVGKLCLSLGSQLRAVVDQTAFSGPLRPRLLQGKRFPPKLRREIERDLAARQRSTYERAVKGSEAVVASILGELQRVPAPGAGAAVKSRFEQGLMDSAAHLRAIGDSEVTRELRLAAFFRGLASGVRAPQYDVCKAGIATLEKEPLTPVSG